MTPALPEAEIARRKALIEDLLREGYAPLGKPGANVPSAVSEAARRLGLSSATLGLAIRSGSIHVDWSLYAPKAKAEKLVSLPPEPEEVSEEPELPRGVDREAADARYARLVAATTEPVQRYVITSAQNATPIHAAFFATLKTYAHMRGAELLVIPYRYRNPTSWHTKDLDHDDWWAADLAPFITDHRFDIDEHLTVLADIKTQPTASRPLSGFETITGTRSAIVGHPKLELTTVATPQSRMAKIMTTTGTCTQRNYLDGKAGAKARFHHTFGACVVEVSGKRFHMRQINATEDGSFIDLDTKYDGRRVSKVKASALVLGDIHVDVVDPAVVKATFEGPDSIVALLKPKHLIFHDLLDFQSRNHHHTKDPFTNYAKFHAGKDDVRAELERACAFVDRYSPEGVVNVLVPSNHPDALARWVKESDPRLDPRNAVFWAQTFEFMCRGAKMTERGASVPCPFNFWAKQLMSTADRTVFLSRGDSFTVEAIELALHGDMGANGARGSLKGFSKIGVKSVTGHRHGPGICDGAYGTGTSTFLRLDYTGGPSGWLQTHCVVYENSKRCLITVIDGEWRA